MILLINTVVYLKLCRKGEKQSHVKSYYAPEAVLLTKSSSGVPCVIYRLLV